MSPDLCSNFRSARATSATSRSNSQFWVRCRCCVLPLRGRLAVKRNKSCFVLPGEPDLRKRLGSYWLQWRDDQLLEDNLNKVVAWPCCMGPQHNDPLYEVLPCYTHTSTYRGSVCCMWETALFCPKILNTGDRNWGHTDSYVRVSPKPLEP